MAGEMSLRALVGGGYDEFWRFRGRYRVVKGSRASKKSKTTALWYVFHMMKYPGANLLVVRKTYRTLHDSCFKELRWAVSRFGVDAFWQFRESPLEATYLPTGQKIYFRGLDDPLKVTSITVDTGYLCWMWVEEAYEVNVEADFDMLDESIRGECPPPLFKQVTLTFNPWNEHIWLKKRFFDAAPTPEVLAMTTNYRCNEWLDKADLALFDRMRTQNPRRYAVAGEGNWGITDGLVYENWKEQWFDLKTLLKERPGLHNAFGLDFGFTNDPTAFFMGLYDAEQGRLYVWDEIYEKGLSNADIAEKLTEKGVRKSRITADSAEPKSIHELRGLGVPAVVAAKKGRDSINHGIQWLQDQEIIIHPRCEHFLREIGEYAWAKDRFGQATNRPVDDNNHLMDAMRYGCERYMGGRWLI